MQLQNIVGFMKILRYKKSIERIDKDFAPFICLLPSLHLVAPIHIQNKPPSVPKMENAQKQGN